MIYFVKSSKTTTRNNKTFGLFCICTYKGKYIIEIPYENQYGKNFLNTYVTKKKKNLNNSKPKL